MTGYRGDVVFRRVGDTVVEQPLRRFGDLRVGVELWVLSPSGRSYNATVYWDRDGGFYWRCGNIVGWLAFCEDERRCWVCTGASWSVTEN